MKLVKPALYSRAGLPSRPKAATPANPNGAARRARPGPASRAARSLATHARATRQKAKVSAFHWTYGHSRSVRDTSGSTGRKACSASAQTVLCSDGYHWFHAREPSTVGHVVLPAS